LSRGELLQVGDIIEALKEMIEALKKPFGGQRLRHGKVVSKYHEIIKTHFKNRHIYGRKSDCALPQRKRI
jgi:hypothetical protein